MVLEDNLAEELCNFKNHENYDNKIIERILHYYKPPILLSKKYLKKYYDESTLTSIAGANSHINFNEPVEQLIYKTLYKIILSKEKNGFPYVNIHNDKIENNLTATFTKQEDREKAKKHFEALFQSAERLFIYDKYLYNNQNSFKEFAGECFPKRRLKISYLSHFTDPTCSQKFCENLKTVCADWEVEENNDKNINTNYNNLHDRYIIIDENIQIILTSGIDHLINNKKDFTYIIRIIKLNR